MNVQLRPLSHHRPPQPAMLAHHDSGREPEDRLTHRDVIAFSTPRILSIAGGALAGIGLAARSGGGLATMGAFGALGGLLGATLNAHAEAVVAHLRPQNDPSPYASHEIKTAAQARQNGALIALGISAAATAVDPTLGALTLLGTSLTVPALLQDRAMDQLTSRS